MCDLVIDYSISVLTIYRRIVAAVDEISNPNAEAPTATKQLAARMAKVIVEAVATKTGKASSGPRTSSFTNKHGEEWQLTVDAKVILCMHVLLVHLTLASQGQAGILAGDETDWETLHIKHDTLQSDFMF